MRRDEALRRLPESYALALRLRDEGLNDGAISRVIDIDSLAVPAFMDLAERKLSQLLEGREG